MRKTKIYATIGPASCSTNTLISLIKAGMDGIRINLSHGNLNTYQKWFANLRQAEEIADKSVDIIADIQGPELRTGPLVENNIKLIKEKSIQIASGNFIGNNDKIFVNYPDLAELLEPGQIILLDDGLIKLKVESINNLDVTCTVFQGGFLGERKGINLPGAKLPLPSLTEKDREDIKMGIELGLDYIMLPFTRSSEDITVLRDFLESCNGSKIGIMAKIENQQGLDNIYSIIDNVEGIVIARGDLGVEVGLPGLPIIQKKITHICQEKDMFCIVVTHMLHSMIESPQPTRAEISDIANAVLDKCSGVMLTGETAIGKYPVQTLTMMCETVEKTEAWMRKGYPFPG